MDSRDFCPDCGSGDHHGCDWPERAREQSIATMYNALASWYQQHDKPRDIEYLDECSRFLVDFIETHNQSLSSRSDATYAAGLSDISAEAES